MTHEFPQQDKAGRSRAVRQSTKARLAALRAERLQRRLSVASSGASRFPEAAAFDTAESPSQTVLSPAYDPAEAPCARVAVDAGGCLEKPSSPPMDTTRARSGTDPKAPNLDAPEPDTEDSADVPHAQATPFPNAEADATDAPSLDHAIEDHAAAETIPTEPSHSEEDSEGPGPEEWLQKSTPQLPASNETRESGVMPKPQSHDLYALPGAGPGLVRLLNRAGIKTLSDMAEADPAILSEKLGLVGELLDLTYWTSRARDLAQAQMD